jgi:hypothetical protein
MYLGGASSTLSLDLPVHTCLVHFSHSNTESWWQHSFGRHVCIALYPSLARGCIISSCRIVLLGAHLSLDENTYQSPHQDIWCPGGCVVCHRRCPASFMCDFDMLLGATVVCGGPLRSECKEISRWKHFQRFVIVEDQCRETVGDRLYQMTHQFVSIINRPSVSFVWTSFVLRKVIRYQLFLAVTRSMRVA